MSDPVLATSGLRVGYRGGLDILRDLDVTVERAQITGVIGANGAGKSTLLRTLFGLLPPRDGSIVFDGEPITQLGSAERKRRGISYLPQHHSTFGQLTVDENLRMGGWQIRRQNALLRERLEYVYDLFPLLAERRRARATALSGGQLRMLAVAKEVVVPPTVLLVDEPSVGMAPNVAATVYAFLEHLVDDGVTVLLVDQNVVAAVECATTVYLLDGGTVARHGASEEFRNNLDAVFRDLLAGAPPPSGGTGR